MDFYNLSFSFAYSCRVLIFLNLRSASYLVLWTEHIFPWASDLNLCLWMKSTSSSIHLFLEDWRFSTINSSWQRFIELNSKKVSSPLAKTTWLKPQLDHTLLGTLKHYPELRLFTLASLRASCRLASFMKSIYQFWPFDLNHNVHASYTSYVLSVDQWCPIPSSFLTIFP